MYCAFHQESKLIAVNILNWSDILDSNQRPLVPQTSALPDCANARMTCTATGERSPTSRLTAWCAAHYTMTVLKLVGVDGFEPTQPLGNRFTVCPSSPTLAHPQYSARLRTSVMALSRPSKMLSWTARLTRRVAFSPPLIKLVLGEGVEPSFVDYRSTVLPLN